MKKLAKNVVAAVLGHQVRKLYKKNDFKVIGVVGSIGKTSTKLAIANVLNKKFKVRYQEGNYNDLVSVPLIFFGEEMPSLFNPFAWINLFWRNQKQLNQPYKYDYVVVELGSDSPGLITEFKRYLKVEIGVLTSIVPEHMAFFKSLDAVAEEELAVGCFSSLVLANKDLSDEKYLSKLTNSLTYGIKKNADFKLTHDGKKISIMAGSAELLSTDFETVSEAELYTLLAASAVAQKLGMSGNEISQAIKKIEPFAGRMQRLEGINHSIIIDDSYNSSPEAVKLALNALYNTEAKQKIAVLGNMNELGEFSEEAHKKIGNLCDPKQLDLVLTIGQDANKYLAEAAEAKGCKVQTFDNPYTIGKYLSSVVKEGGVVLVKGSQNGVFAEEAIKAILANPKDAKKLVRQSDYWLGVKEKAFGK